MTGLSFTVNEKGTIGLDPLEVPEPTQRPAPHTGLTPDVRAPRPLVNRKQDAQDELRRPQAVVLFRALKAAGSAGLSWKECWALSDDEEFVVGPIVIWMRFHGCDIEARYDPVAGETRFYIA